MCGVRAVRVRRADVVWTASGRRVVQVQSGESHPLPTSCWVKDGPNHDSIPQCGGGCMLLTGLLLTPPAPPAPSHCHLRMLTSAVGDCPECRARRHRDIRRDHHACAAGAVPLPPARGRPQAPCPMLFPSRRDVDGRFAGLSVELSQGGVEGTVTRDDAAVKGTCRYCVSHKPQCVPCVSPNVLPLCIAWLSYPLCVCSPTQFVPQSGGGGVASGHQ